MNRAEAMQVIVAYQHAVQADRLQALLGEDAQVRGMAQLPAHGTIDADVLVTTRLASDEAARLRVRLLHAPATGLDGIALEALPADCQVCIVRGHEVPIAEYVTHAILEHFLDRAAQPWQLDEKHWPAAYLQRPQHEEAAGHTVLILGFGHIGREIAVRARALQMQILAVTRRGDSEELAHRTVAFDRLSAVLPEADAVVVCCPLDQTTRGCIGAAELARMKPGALLVNVARGEVVDEEALFRALRDRRIARAVLDVWYAYPREADASLAPSRFPFHTLPNVRCTPHVSGWTNELLPRRYRLVAQNIRRLRDGEPLLNRVR